VSSGSSVLQAAVNKLPVREKVLGEEHPDTAMSLNNLAEFYRVLGEFDQAESLSRRALTICEQKLGPNNPITVKMKENYARLANKISHD
jgi:hypothetical protein